MGQSAISVENVSKTYRIQKSGERRDTLAGTVYHSFRKWSSRLASPVRRRQDLEEVRVLDNISFTVGHGEVLGIIGPNGAGKTTLLKIISRITGPDSGRVLVNGRVASLLEVGTGFHPDLSGLENIYVNGTMLGMRRQEVRAKLDEIVAYAGVERFLETPIRQYSLGMRMRLAFSVAAHLDAEILLIDEILAVGDANFQQKCLRKMNEVTHDGRTALFVSHNMSALKNLCPRSIYIQKGKLEGDGPSDFLVKKYLDENLSKDASLDADEIAARAEYSTAARIPTFRLMQLALCDAYGQEKRDFDSDEEILLRLRLCVMFPVKDMRVLVSLVDEDGNYLLTSQVSDNSFFVHEYHLVHEGEYEAVCRFPAGILGENEYYLTVEIIHPSVEHLILRKVLSFAVNYKGHNNILLNGYGKSLFRPVFPWEFGPAEEEKLTNEGGKGSAHLLRFP